MRYVAVAMFGLVVGLALPNHPDKPVDDTGRTSIVVEYDCDGWVELRGPARFTLLNEWEARDGRTSF